jgi:cell division inhibitor SepF
MADRLKRAAAWLGLVTDDRYPEYDDTEPTEGVSREELLAGADRRSTNGSANGSANGSESASVTPLETRRPAGREPVIAAPRGATATATAPAVVEAPAEQPERADLSRIVTIHPRSFNDARTIGEHFRDGVPVIMNLSQMENADAKRLVDFAAGLILGLRGNIERVTSKVFLLSPQNVTVTAEDKERIAGGFFNQS